MLTSKYESEFRHGARLIFEVSRLTESQARRDVAKMRVGQVSPKEEASILKGGSHRNRRALASRPIHQIDDILIVGVPRTCDVLPAYREREAVFECATYQYRTGLRCVPLQDANLLVGGNGAVLIVGLDDPIPLGVRVDYGVLTAVVLDGCGQGLKRRLSQVSHPCER